MTNTAYIREISKIRGKKKRKALVVQTKVKYNEFEIN